MCVLCATLKNLATDSHKYRAKKDRKMQRSSFRDVLRAVEVCYLLFCIVTEHNKFKMTINNEPGSKHVEKKSISNLIWLNQIALIFAINTCNLTKYRSFGLCLLYLLLFHFISCFTITQTFLEKTTCFYQFYLYLCTESMNLVIDVIIMYKVIKLKYLTL